MGEEKSKHAGLTQEDGFGSALLHKSLIAEAGKLLSKAVHLLNKSIISVHMQEKSIIKHDQIIMIGPGGLLLVVSYLSAVPRFSVFCVGLQKKKIKN